MPLVACNVRRLSEFPQDREHVAENAWRIPWSAQCNIENRSNFLKTSIKIDYFFAFLSIDLQPCKVQKTSSECADISLLAAFVLFFLL